MATSLQYTIPTSFDFVVITIVDDAYRLAKEIFGPVTRFRAASGRIYLSGFVTVSDNSKAGCSVAVAYTHDQSNIPMTKLTSDVLADLRPAYILVLDIGGGIAFRKGAPKLGGLAVSDDVEYYGHVRQDRVGQIDRPLVIDKPSKKLLEVAQKMENKWISEMQTPWPSNEGGPTKQEFGLILCGDELKGNPQELRLRRLLRKHTLAIAFDMESAGVARAIYDGRLSPHYTPVEYLIVRGISDYVNVKGNRSTRKKWRQYSSEAALRFGRQLVRDGHILLEPTQSGRPRSEIASGIVSFITREFDEKNYASVVRTGSALSRPLWNDGHYLERILVGRLVYKAASALNEMRPMAAALIDDLGWTHVALGNEREAEKNIIMGIEIAKKLGDKGAYLTAKGNRHLAGIETRRRNYDKALKYMSTAQKAAKGITGERERLEMIAGILFGEAELYLDKSDRQSYKIAVRKSLQAIEIYKDLNDNERLAKCHRLLGMIYFRLDDLERAERTAYKCLEISKRITRRDEIITALVLIARIQIKKGNKIEARMNLEKALDEAKKIGHDALMKEIRILIDELGGP